MPRDKSIKRKKIYNSAIHTLSACAIETRERWIKILTGTIVNCRETAGRSEREREEERPSSSSSSHQSISDFNFRSSKQVPSGNIKKTFLISQLDFIFPPGRRRLDSESVRVRKLYKFDKRQIKHMKKPASFEAAVEESSKKKVSISSIERQINCVNSGNLSFQQRRSVSAEIYVEIFLFFRARCWALSVTVFQCLEKKAFSGTRWVSFPSSFFLFLSSRCHMEVEEDRILKEK